MALGRNAGRQTADTQHTPRDNRTYSRGSSDCDTWLEDSRSPRLPRKRRLLMMRCLLLCLRLCFVGLLAGRRAGKAANCNRLRGEWHKRCSALAPVPASQIQCNSTRARITAITQVSKPHCSSDGPVCVRKRVVLE